jgi:cytochrome b pre-mRNA-processing protein 3
VGDVVVGKHIGRLMSVLGGRLGAFRDALRAPGDDALAAAVARNVSLLEGADPGKLAAALRTFEQQLAALDDESLLAGRIAR